MICNDGYKYLLSSPSVCVSKCPVKTWTNYLEGYCGFCDISCKNCTDNTKNCLECENGYYPLEDNQKLCFSNCPVGYILDLDNKICKKCPISCEICNLENNCIMCFENYFLNKKLKQCFTKCDPGFYPNKFERVCSECSYPCFECISPDMCLSCPANLYLNPLLITGNCVNNCPDGYWADSSTNKCILCDPRCKLCQNLKKCLSCKNDFYYLKETNECLSNCPKQYYYNWEIPDLKLNSKIIKITDSVRTCEKCEIGCLMCSNSKDYCFACDINFFLLFEQNKCIENCPLENYYADINTRKCSKCNVICKSCKGPQINDCLSCDLDSGLILKNGYCIKEGCPPGFILIENNSCFGLIHCIEYASLFVPKIFNIAADAFIGKFDFKIKEICASFKKGFGIIWDRNSTMINKAVISADNTTYLLKREDLVESELNLRINVYYSNKFFLTSFNETSVLVLNKV